MSAFVRSVVAVVLGVLAAFMLVAGGDALAIALYPLPPGTDTTNPDALKALVATLPAGALIPVVLGWAVAGFGGAWVAAKLAARSPLGHALIVGALLLAATVANLYSIPHPAWMWIGGIVLVPLGVLIGARLARRARPTD